MLLFVESVSKKESLYTDALDGRDLAGINKVAEMPGRSEDIKMSGIKHIPSESNYTTFIWSRLRIQSI